MATYSGNDLIAQMNKLTIPPNCLAMWGMGQMGIALKGAGTDMIYIDVCLTDVVGERVSPDVFRRAFPPPVEPSKITNASLILCSHEHLDHTDPQTLGPMSKASPDAKFVISGWSHDLMDEAGVAPERRTVLPALEPTQFGGVTITAIPAAHYDLEHDSAKGYRWLGFMIQTNGITFYHSGDTLVYPGYLDYMKALPTVDVALVCANGRDTYREQVGIVGNLMPVEAAWLAKELGWDLLIGGHNDLYEWNTIEDGALANELRRINKRQKHHTLQPGELYLYVK